jgi:hypothetical protein
MTGALFVLFLGASSAVPQRQIPSPVLLELRDLEDRFDAALVHDCAPDRCVSKGCFYGDHAVVDMPRGSSLPGIPQQEGPGSVPAQEYLTSARCEFAYEKDVAPKDVQALTRRLDQRLSKGWLRVSVTGQVLEPISAELAGAVVTARPSPDATPAALDGADELRPGLALRELWKTLLPHFAWMIAVVLGTLAVLTLLWAYRRLGLETLEEKALLAQLAAGSLEKKPDEMEAPKEPVPLLLPASKTPDEQDAAFVVEQQKSWTERIAKAELNPDESVVVALLHQWLKAGEFALLAKAIMLFGDSLSSSFSSDGELAARKVEFAEYLKNLDAQQLPTDADFFRTLEHHAISSSLLSQHDADLYRSIREDFGSSGVANLIGALPPRHGALLFALVPEDIQHEVTRALHPKLRAQLGSQLLLSNRVSSVERAHLFAALDAARKGLALPPPPPAVTNGIADLGREFDAPGALSVLFTHIEPAARKVLLEDAFTRWGDSFPFWYFNILYPDMLLRLPAELQADLLLEVEVRALAGWCSVHDPKWQEAFLTSLNSSLQKAVRTNMAFASRAEQLRMARRGHIQLVDAMKRIMALGKVSFVELVA